MKDTFFMNIITLRISIWLVIGAENPFQLFVESISTHRILNTKGIKKKFMFNSIWSYKGELGLGIIGGFTAGFRGGN